jgi:hypothetical protein
MADFEILTKEEFLTSYSYLTEQRRRFGTARNFKYAEQLASGLDDVELANKKRN